MAEARYIYGSAAPKHGYFGHSLPGRDDERRDRLEVVPGGRRDSRASASYDLAIRAAKIAVVAIILFACIGFIRITLASATVSSAVEARELESGISELRSEVSNMQAEKSSLSNPVRIKKDAVKLGMANPETTQIIELEKDIVVVDENGSLSLTQSLGSLG